MPVSGYDTMPSADLPYAAYRPILFLVLADDTNPVVYLDVYFNGLFYKTLSKTHQTGGGWVFDIQDAAQEYLGKFLGPRAGGAILVAAPLITQCFARARGSIFDTDGFIVPDPTVPIQATDGVAASAGSGTQSNTFYIVNSTIQHEQNMVYPEHLNAYKTGTWGATTYPLSHRRPGYRVCPLDSDYFPILSDVVPASVRIHYVLKDGDSGAGSGDIACIGVGSLAGISLPGAVLGEPYEVRIPLSGTEPFVIDGETIPDWMTADIDGTDLVLSGTPDAGGTVSVSVVIQNCGGDNVGTLSSPLTVTVCNAVGIPAPNMPDARAGEPYLFVVPLTGDAPFEIDGSSKPAWMTITIVGSTLQFTGTPTNDDVDTLVTASVDLCNCTCAGVETYTDDIEVFPSNNFILNAAANFRIDAVTGTGAPAIGPTAINGQRKGHQAGLSGSYLISITGTIINTTHVSAYVNGTRVDCWLVGSTIGTVITAGTHAFSITATEDDTVTFSIELGNC